MRLAALVVMLVSLAGPMARAQVSNEFWPEVQYHHWFSDRTRAIAMTAVSRDLASHASYQAEQGLTLEHRFTDFFLGRIGYRHGGATDGDPYTENRLLTEQTFRLHLPWKVIAEYRTREDFRWLDTGFSMRLRERIQVQRDFTVDGYTFTPYASAEVYFDTRPVRPLPVDRWRHPADPPPFQRGAVPRAPSRLRRQLRHHERHWIDPDRCVLKRRQLTPAKGVAKATRSDARVLIRSPGVRASIAECQAAETWRDTGDIQHGRGNQRLFRDNGACAPAGDP
jgi:hypothetical protein